MCPYICDQRGIDYSRQKVGLLDTEEFILIQYILHRERREKKTIVFHYAQISETETENT